MLSTKLRLFSDHRTERPATRAVKREEEEDWGREIAMTGKNRIMIYGPKNDGTYIVEFRTADGEALAISIPGGEARVTRHFQDRMTYGLFVPEVPRNLWRVPCVCLAEPSLNLPNRPLKTSMGFPRTPPVASHAKRDSRLGRNDMKGRLHASSFCWCCPGSFRHYTNPCGLLHRSGTDYEAMQDR
jgi:hypothetical protein